MGNSRSQVPPRQRKKTYLLYVINRTWNGLRRDREHRRATDCDKNARKSSSRCSGCKGCDYQQDSLMFDSESEMAPNAEEEMLAVKPWGLQQDKERLRPPTYNAEDYAIALRRWGRRPLTSVQDSQGTLPSTTSSSSGYVSGSGGEMTLRQFTSVSELLNKLRADLRLAFPSFVQEFASAPADGITLLLETLRGVQLVQSTPPSGQSGPRIGTRRAALDELGCVECLAACTERCADAPRLLAQAQPGLLALAVCLTSSLNRSRVLALQLLTKVCQTSNGHSAVSEAVSTLRLRYGEGGRFRFLAGALLAPRAALALRVAGVSFLNAFLKSSPRAQTRLYIQAEACEAGLEPRILQEWLAEVDGRGEDSTLMDLLKKEILKWSQNCVDVESLQKRLARAEETCAVLGNKVTVLQNQLEKLQLEKRNGWNQSDRKTKPTDQKTQRLSSNGEDEGISSSERSSSPEGLHQKDKDNDQETTIDDVIEELRIIVKDAEEEDRIGQKTRNDNKVTSSIPPEDSKTKKIKEKSRAKELLSNIDTKEIPVSAYGLDNAISGDKANNDKSSLKIVVKGPDVEDAIVPAILYPQPPRKSLPCLSTILATRQAGFIENSDPYHLQDDEECEEETLGDGSDSLLSASRLKYNKNEVNLAGNRLFLGKNGIESKESFRENKSKKTIRNYEAPVKSVDEADPTARHLEVYRQFEPARLTSDRYSSRYKKDAEKKKSLRRSVSHDYLSSDNSSPHLGRSASKIEGKIRKFESLNSFENSSLQNFARNSSHLATARKSVAENSRRIRRSESCHQVSQPQRRGSKAGSDGGLHYITDFDLEPVMTCRSKPEVLDNSLSKSLDRIDEGLDTMVDIVIKGNEWQTRLSQKDKSKVPRSFEKGKEGQKRGRRPNVKNEEDYCPPTLRSDELYRETHWNSHGLGDNLPVIGGFYQEKGKFNMNDGIFLPRGRPYDAFGLGKARFNAGKYSGNPPVADAVGGRRSTGANRTGKGGKVTDILSGLY